MAENFRGRKLSQILRFCGYSRKFFPWNSGAWHPLAWQQQAIRESFLCENCIFHQFAKVFSLESFPLYGISWSATCITDRQGVKLVNVVPICPKQCILQQYLWVHFTLLKGVHPGVLFCSLLVSNFSRYWIRNGKPLWHSLASKSRPGLNATNNLLWRSITIV